MLFGKGFFGGLFDFDGDGKLDDFEKAADTAAFLIMADDFMRDAEDRPDYGDDSGADCDGDDSDF